MVLKVLLNKALLWGLGASFIGLTGFSIIQTYRLNSLTTENKSINATNESYKQALKAMQDLEKRGREAAKQSAQRKIALENQRALHLNSIERTPSDETVDPLLFDTIERLYKPSQP